MTVLKLLKFEQAQKVLKACLKALFFKAVKVLPPLESGEEFVFFFWLLVLLPKFRKDVGTLLVLLREHLSAPVVDDPPEHQLLVALALQAVTVLLMGSDHFGHPLGGRLFREWRVLLVVTHGDLAALVFGVLMRPGGTGKCLWEGLGRLADILRATHQLEVFFGYHGGYSWFFLV